MINFFRASGFGNSAIEHYAQKMQGYRFETSDSMKRGTIAEDILINGVDEVRPKWIIKPATLEGTGFTRWNKWAEANQVDLSAENIIGQDTWDDAVGAAECLRTACANLGLDLVNSRKQQTVALKLDGVPELDGYDTGTIPGTCDYVDSGRIVDFKVFSNEPTKEFLDKYDWQMSVYSHSLMLPASLLFAIKKGNNWVAKVIHPTLISKDALSKHAKEVIVDYLYITALNKPNSF